jgi:hypothetical protein
MNIERLRPVLANPVVIGSLVGAANTLASYVAAVSLVFSVIVGAIVILIRESNDLTRKTFLYCLCVTLSFSIVNAFGYRDISDLKRIEGQMFFSAIVIIPTVFVFLIDGLKRRSSK